MPLMRQKEEGLSPLDPLFNFDWGIEQEKRNSMNAIEIGHTMRKSKQKILVTGANGQLGRTLQQKAKTNRISVVFFQ